MRSFTNTILYVHLSFASLLFCQTAAAHPVPDIPVRSSFHADGSLTIRVEVDPRCFAEDPLNEPYLENALLQSFHPDKKQALFSKAEELLMKTIEFRMEPVGRVLPDFKMRFTTFADTALTWNTEQPATNTVECAETPVVITAEWTTTASVLSGYQIRAAKVGKFSIRVIHRVNDKPQPLNVLFPGEESDRLDLIPWAKTVGAKSREP